MSHIMLLGSLILMHLMEWFYIWVITPLKVLYDHLLGGNHSDNGSQFFLEAKYLCLHNDVQKESMFSFTLFLVLLLQSHNHNLEY